MLVLASESALLEFDAQYLESKGYEYSANQCANGPILVVIHGYPLPEHYTPSKCDLLIKLPPGYPNASLDMFWTRPDVKLRSGVWPRSSDVHEMINGALWQRWSRHLTASSWRPGTDCIQTFLAVIRRELLKGF